MDIKKKIIYFVFTFVLIMCLTLSISYAHSGKTDSSGGHKDNKNKSGLGSYHYHCGGYPAHLHQNGICPYSNNLYSQSNINNTDDGAVSSKADMQQSVIEATSIQINESIGSIKVGERKGLTVKIIPDEATNKIIYWKSSDSAVLSVSTDGVILALKEGIASITATTNNGKSSTIKIIVVGKQENKYNMERQQIKNTEKCDSNESNQYGIVYGVTSAGLIGGVGYLAYSKMKKK